MRVFEFGTGGSTLFFAQHVSEIVSVEHDHEWFRMVANKMSSSGGRNWLGLLRPPEPEAGASCHDPADPLGYVSADPRYEGFIFRSYASAIDQFPDEHFDLVLVDGRARPSCILHALPKVRSWIILDNTEREYYLEMLKGWLEGYEMTHFKGAVPGFAGEFPVTTFIKTN
jgi:hypothetical protein